MQEGFSAVLLGHFQVNTSKPNKDSMSSLRTIHESEQLSYWGLYTRRENGKYHVCFNVFYLEISDVYS